MLACVRVESRRTRKVSTRSQFVYPARLLKVTLLLFAFIPTPSPPGCCSSSSPLLLLHLDAEVAAPSLAPAAPSGSTGRSKCDSLNSVKVRVDSLRLRLKEAKRFDSFSSVVFTHFCRLINDYCCVRIPALKPIGICKPEPATLGLPQDCRGSSASTKMLKHKWSNEGANTVFHGLKNALECVRL